MSRARILIALLAAITGAFPGDSAVQPGTIRERIDQGRYREAVDAARQLVAQEQERSGPKSASVGEALDLLVEALDVAGLAGGAEARQLADTALDLKQSALGPDDPAVAVTLDLEARIRFGEPNAARALLERALAIREKALPPDDPAIGASCYWMAKLLVDVKELPKAQEFAQRTLTIRERSLGSEHPDTLRALVVSGELLALQAQRKPCVELMDRAVASSKSVLGPDHPETGLALRGRAFCDMTAGDQAKARPLVEQALALHEASLGPDHPWVAQDLTFLAWLTFKQGDQARGVELDERALTILERAYGPDDARLGIVLNHLADFLDAQGDPGAAAERAEQALRIARKAFDEHHPAVAFALQRLGNARHSERRYSESLSLLKQSSAILKKAHGPDSEEYSVSVINQARPATSLGDFATARALLEEALAIRTTLYGADSPNLLGALDNLGRVRASQGDSRAAIELYRRELSIMEKQYGADHRSLVSPLLLLAKLHQDAGETDEARRLADRALALAEKGANKRDIAAALYRIGILERNRGELSAALAHQERGYTLWCEVMGHDDPAAAAFKQERAFAELGLGRHAAALEHALEVEAETLESFRLAARYVSRREIEDLSRFTGAFVALTVLDSPAGPDLPPETVSRVWDSVIRSRAVIGDELIARHRNLASRNDPALAATLKRWQRACTRLSRLLQYQVEAGDAVSADRLRRAKEEVAAIEVELAESSVEQQQLKQRQAIGFEDVVRSLPPKSAIVAYDLNARVESVSPLRTTYTYMAFVLGPGRSKPVVLPLGSGEEIDRLVQEWRRHASTPPSLAGDDSLREAAEALRRAVWDPVRATVEGADVVFVVPDGSLYDVSFPALHDRDGRFLIEGSAVLHQVATERDLVPSPTDRRPGAGLLALGDPDFDGAPAKLGRRVSAAVAASAAQPTVTEPYRGPLPECETLHSMHFEPLPHSGVEVDEIVALWKKGFTGEKDRQVVRLIGGESGEGALKRLAPGKRVIHLATHATFVGGECSPESPHATVPEQRRGARVRGADTAQGLLALAGANRRENADPTAEDGVLTSEEIAALDLTRAEWVVLSACETASGKLRPDEGVYSLQRAFRLAGARTVIASLWRVPDFTTAEWMRHLYAARARGASTALAVRDASLELLRERRRSGLSTHPLFWGSFVASGDWR